MISRSRLDLKTRINVSEIQSDSEGIAGVLVWLASLEQGSCRWLSGHLADDGQHSSRPIQY